MAKKKLANDKELRNAIVAQALREIQFARSYKQGKVTNWKKNEAMYYGKKVQVETSRTNIELGRMAEFVHTILSKIDAALSFKFTKRKEAQLKRVARLNSLRKVDQDKDNWDMKDLVGKKQGVVYGRAIYSYFADSEYGYCAHLDNVDVYDFLIDPSAGGIDIERGRYMGDYGVVFDKTDLEDGIQSGAFLKTETEALIDGVSNATESSQEETNKKERIQDNNITSSQKEISDSDKFKFWRWGTTYKGQRYYLLLSETGATAIRVDEIENVFESSLWWYWTWAAFPDLTEFWTPSYCDYVREIFMGQSVAVNQGFDNTEEVNKPQKVVNVNMIEDLASLKYKRDGYIKVKKEFDVNKAVQTLNVPSIDTPIKMFELLESIQEKASGVTAAAKGVAPGGADQKVGIYEGNQENTADRFGLLNKSYAYGYKRFAKLWEAGVKEHLNKKIAIEILGPDGIDLQMVSKRDIFKANEEFGLIVEASDAEIALSETEKKAKIDFLSSIELNPLMGGVQNNKKAYEIAAGIVGFDEETIRQLMDTSEFGDAEIMSEAERDIESLLEGQKIDPNPAANTAYKQRFVDYMQDHKDDINMDQFNTLASYVLLLDPIIMANMARQANAIAAKAVIAAPAAGPGQPVNPNPAVPVDPTATAPLPAVA